MFPDEDPETADRRLVEAFMRAGKAHRTLLEHHLNRDGMYRGQHQVLMCIWRNQGKSQKEIARLHNVSTATIAIALKKLEQGGYIERLVDPDDNRFNKIGLTEKGREAAEMSLSFFSRVEEGMFEGLSGEEKEEFYRLLTRLSDNLEQMLQKDLKEGQK